jgi:hypothetical protein
MKRQSNTDRNKKLKLDRQVIRELKPSQLEQNVAGGAMFDDIGEQDRTEPC